MSTTTVEKNLRILVVDDNRAVHEDFRKILCSGKESSDGLSAAEEMLFGEPAADGRTPSFEVDSAYQGEEGLAKAKQAAAAGRPYALAFVDVRMPPGLDGVETSARLWQYCPDLQIVICTAYSDYSWNSMLARLGNNDKLVILKKPFDTMEVLQLANALTEKWRLHQADRLKLEELEKLVQERTCDLRTSNENLQTEIVVRKEAEARIREQARMLDLAHDAIHVEDLEGCVRYWNKSAERLYGWSSTEVLGGRIAEMYCADAEDLKKEGKARAQVEQGDWSGELNRLTKDRRALLVQSRWTLVGDAGGQAKAILVIDTDITEKKQMEAQFLHAQRMDSIGTLAAGIAHDLNNILAPVLMIGPLLRAEIKDPGTLGLLESMEWSAQRGAGIVKQILTFARGLKGAKAPLQTHRLLKEFSGFIGETFPRNIVVRLAAPKDLWLIEGNSTELHQVLVNLCLNAREAMPQGGTLTLSAMNLRLEESSAASIPNAKAGRYVVWTVADTGAGVAPKNVDRVFDPFFTTKEVGRGPGLGLSTVLGIVKSCGGCIELKSELGRGTEMKVYLPALAADRATPPGQPLPEPPRGAGELILIIDGDEALALVLGKVLTASGYRVLASSDEAEAVELYRRDWREIGAVLADLTMADMGEVLGALRQINPAVRVVGSSTMSPGMIPASLGVPEEHFLRKPYQTSALLDTLRRVLGHEERVALAAVDRSEARREVVMR
ncbi:MAG TPA: response regulator [Candidatus Acidoferrum sp.]|nr:response regulator [Candidatus Acidoferrum sp.]